MRKPIVAVVALTALVMLAIPAGATSATRWASRTGSGSACTEAAPCSLTKAITNAVDGDVVIVKFGTYRLHAAVSTPESITVSGQDGHPRPRLRGSVAGKPLLSVYGQESHVSRLDIANGGSGEGTVGLASGGRVDNMIVSAPGSQALAVAFGNSPLTPVIFSNSTVRATGATATGLRVQNAGELRNVTVVADGAGATGISVRGVCSSVEESCEPGCRSNISCDPTDAKATLTNVIARGTTADISATTQDAEETATVDVRYSNYRPTKVTTDAMGTLNDLGHNQSEEPVFVDRPGHDFHELSASPTVDAGLTDSLNGTGDLDGNARAVGRATDIGAYELTAPHVVTGIADKIEVAGATFHGLVNPDGHATIWRFEYGKTTAYGASTPERDLAAGNADTKVKATLTGLAAGTYHYRLRGVSSEGTSVGADRTFTTSNWSFPGVTLKKQTVKVGDSNKAPVKLTCPAKTHIACDGALRLRKKNKQHPAKPIKLGKRTFHLLPGATGKVKVKLNVRARKLLDDHGELKARGIAVAHETGGVDRTTSAKVKLERKAAAAASAAR